MSRLVWNVIRNRLSCLTKKINIKKQCIRFKGKDQLMNFKYYYNLLLQPIMLIREKEKIKLSMYRAADIVMQKVKMIKFEGDQLMDDRHYIFLNSPELLQETQQIILAFARAADIVTLRKFHDGLWMGDKHEPDDKYYDLLNSRELLRESNQIILGVYRAFQIVNQKGKMIKFKGEQQMDDKCYELLMKPEMLQETQQIIMAVKRAIDIFQFLWSCSHEKI